MVRGHQNHVEFNAMRMTLGAKEKRERRLGERLGVKGDRSNGPKAAIARRNYPPGVHGQTSMRKRLTGYGLQLREKQKAKVIYGLSESQFQNYVKKATKKKGNSALLLGQLLECRLDNVVFRLGLARSRSEARQAVSHAHFCVNGKRVNIPSYRVEVGDVITLREKSAKNKFFTEKIVPTLSQRETPKWVAIDSASLQGKMISMPDQEDLPQNVDRSMVIEFYSR